MVLGSGQSAAESLLHIRNSFPTSTIYSLHRGVGFRLKDTGHLSNAIYYPEETDYFYNLSPEARLLALKEMFPADYGNVNFTVSSALFAQMYEDKVRGEERIIMLNRKEVAQISLQEGGYKVHLTDIYTREPSSVDADILVLATGYYEERCPSLLENLKPYMQAENDGNIKVGRNYQIEMKENFIPSIFLCGMSERTHGISDTQSWSMMALKADAIFKTLLPRIEIGLAVRTKDSARSKVA
ncbi:MAG: SidA/IucD/PvdA family monooxygenase [Nitrososphaera sp.]